MKDESTLTDLLDKQPIGAYQISVIALCFAIMVIDGYDLFIIGMVIPKIAADFGVKPASITPVLALQSLGLALGTALIGIMSDRHGRKKALLVSVFGFAVFTLFSVLARDLYTFAFLRLVTGFFLAGVIPNAIALANEIAPMRLRQGFVGVVFSGFAVGATVASLVNGHILANHSWQTAFVTAAVAGFAVLPLIFFVLPESTRFLLQHAWGREQAIRQLRRMLPGIEVDPATLVLDGKQPPRSSVRNLFSEGRRNATLLMWLTFALSFIALSGFAALGAVVLNLTAGFSLQVVGTLMAAFSLGGLVGSGLSGFVLDRFGPRIGLWFWYGACTASWLTLGLTVGTGMGIGMIATMAFAGAAMTGAQSALNSYVPTVYPTKVRATGVGWAFGIGRMFSIASPLLFSGFVAAPGKQGLFFLSLAVPTLLVMICVPFLTRPPPQSEGYEA
jgi:AAHS family 4-hydroxybenzoate transporter-like MFS transporter